MKKSKGDVKLKKFLNQVNIKGQSLVEALVFLLLSLVLVKATLAILWVFINIFYMEHFLYQGLICVASKREVAECEREVLKQIRRLNSMGKISSLEIKKLSGRFSSQFKGEIQWIFLKQKMSIRQTFVPPQY